MAEPILNVERLETYSPSKLFPVEFFWFEAIFAALLPISSPLHLPNETTKHWLGFECFHVDFPIICAIKREKVETQHKDSSVPGIRL